jgi:uncharacterized membrane protein
MSNLVAIVFDDETTAFEMRAALLTRQTQYLIEMEDSVVVTKTQKGAIKPGGESHGGRGGRWWFLGYVDRPPVS